MSENKFNNGWYFANQGQTNQNAGRSGRSARGRSRTPSESGRRRGRNTTPAKEAKPKGRKSSRSPGKRAGSRRRGHKNSDTQTEMQPNSYEPNVHNVGPFCRNATLNQENSGVVGSRRTRTSGSGFRLTLVIVITLAALAYWYMHIYMKKN